MSASPPKGTGTHQLQAILPDCCALTWQNALTCLAFAVLFLYLCYLPVPTGQVWYEVANGQAIVNSETMSESVLPYSEGIRTLTTSWLGQAFVYKTYQLGGPEWLSCMFALIQIATLAIWAFVFQRLSGRTWCALLAVPIVMASSIDVNALGSSTLGLLAFALVALTMLRTLSTKQVAKQSSELAWSSASLWQWGIVVGLFVLWANLDISVLIGVGILGTLALSRLIGVLVKRDGHGSIFTDRELHHRTWLFELCLIATLLQPSGLAMWQAIFWSANNPIMHALGGWSPVMLASWRGVWIAIAWLGWISASRRTNSVPYWNIGCAIFLTLIVTCFQTQMVWFATTMCFLAAGLLPRLHQPTKSTAPEPAIPTNINPSLRFAYTMVCGLLIWMAFSLSPIGSLTMAGKQRTASQLFGSNTPIGATAFLTEDRPTKVIWTPKYWADHLQVEGDQTQVMANLNDALLTPRIEKDYQSIFYGGKNWQRLLRRYQIDNLVVDKENQTELMRELRVNAGPFKKVFEDEISVIYRRTGQPANQMATGKDSQPKVQSAFKKAAWAKPSSSTRNEASNSKTYDLKRPAANLFDDQPGNSKSIFGD